MSTSLDFVTGALRVNLSGGLQKRGAKSTRHGACILAAISAAGMMTAAAKADLTDPATNPNLVFKVLPQDLSGTTLTPEAGPVGTIDSQGDANAVTRQTIGGIDSLVFDGTGGFHLASTISNTTGNWTIFAVVLPTAVGANAETIIAGASGSLQYRIDGSGVNANEPATLSRNQYQYGNASVAVSNTAYSLIDVTNNPGVARPNGTIFDNNGVVVGDAGSDAQVLGNFTRFGTADNGGGVDNEFFQGDLAELLVYNTSLSSSDRATVQSILEHNFGILSNNYKWVGGTGPFSTASNWDQNSVPNDVNQEQATINNGGTAQILGTDTIGLKNFYVGDTASSGINGNVVQSGGSVTVGNQFVIGNNQGTGTYNMSAGTFTYSGPSNVGPAGNVSSAASVINLSGTASFTTTGGGSVVIGEGTGPSTGSGYGILNMTDSSTFTTSTSSQFLIGNDGAGTVGIVNISGNASLVCNSWLAIGRESGTGTLNLSGNGTITKVPNTAGGITFGGSDTGGVGTLNQTGGTVNNTGTFTWIGEQTGSSGTWNISAGTANLQAVNVGLNGGGTLTVSGTGLFISSTGVYVATDSGSTGVINLNGGTLSTVFVAGGGGTSAALNFNGGVLQATASSAPFLYGFAAGGVKILAGGAIIDSNSNNITIPASITSPTGVAGNLTKIGAGTLQLSGSNTYGGSTIVSVGTLQLKQPTTPVTVPNFSFETPVVAPPGYLYNPTNASWTFTGQAGITNGGGFNINGAAPDGIQAAFVQGTGSVSEPITFPTTGSYTIGFFSEQRGGGGNANYQQISVDIDSNDLTSGGIQPTANWAQTTYVVSETAGSHTLSFIGINFLGGDNTALVDDVTVAGNFGSTPSNAIPSTSPVTIADNAVFDLNGALQQIGSLSGTSLASVTLGTGALTIGAGGSAFAGTISGTGTLSKIGTGTQTLSGSNSYSGGTTVGSGTDSPTLIFSGSLSFPTNTTLTVKSGTAQIGVHTGGAANIVVLSPSTLTIGGSTGAWTGTVDVTNNDMVLHGAALATVTNQIASGYAGGAWTGTGITSSTAAANTSHLTAVGVMVNDNGSGTAVYSSFDGASTIDGDILVKYTYYGDANLDGAVDGSDYTKIDAGFHSAGALTGWQNGDFNYDGKIDGSDYTLIDNAFNTQGSTLGSNPASVIASSTAQFAGSSAVPEPTSIGMISVGVVGLLGRRRRK